MRLRLRHGLLGLALALILAGAIVAGAGAQVGFRGTPVFVFDTADFVLRDDMTPPAGDGVAWQHVALPDNWYRSHPGVSGAGWYQVEFTMPPGPYSIHTLYLPRGSARGAAFFLNGGLATTIRIQGDANALNWDQPLRFAISPTLLRPGRNVLAVRVDAAADLRQGLSRMTLGPAELVLPTYFRRWALQVDSLRMFGGASLLAGLLAFAFWMRSRSDRVMLWFSVTALAWALMALPQLGPRLGIFGFTADLALFPERFAYALPLLVLCLRLGGGRNRPLEGAIWLFTLAGAVLTPFGGQALRAGIVTVWSTVYLALLIALLAWLVATRARQRDRSFWVLIGAALVAALLSAHDFGRWMGWLDYDNVTLAHFHVPLVLLAIGATIVTRHFRAVASVEQAKAELEERVAAKTREIAASYERLREADHERALAGERSRIMADMHDGVGASLLGLLGMIRSGRAEPGQIERRVHEALVELRLAVDSFEPVDGDLGVVLGNVRHRLRDAIEGSGVRFLWQVGELPHVDYLTPKAVLAVQRIVLEAIANALQHARARTITVRTAVDAPHDRLVIAVIDDGTGFEASTVPSGRGLGSLHNRARGVGGAVDVASSAAGTTVTLTLPLSARTEPTMGRGPEVATADEVD